MKNLKIVAVLLLLSLQAGATGYSNNMFVVQKKLSQTQITSKKSKATVVRTSDANNSAKITSEDDNFSTDVREAAKAFTRTVSSWIVRIIYSNNLS